MNTRLNYVEDWLLLARKANWSVTKLADLCNVSVRTMERHFLKTTGKTPKVWLAEQRLKRARELLSEGSSVKETAFQLGYKYPHHFSRGFKGYWGYCPTMQTALLI
ncbi:MAG: helix-turn-helix transcriptional regulator [Verrucomicrobiota bacterium]|jgi:transcriptional regulator GlxA family with amidase domain